MLRGLHLPRIRRRICNEDLKQSKQMNKKELIGVLDQKDTLLAEEKVLRTQYESAKSKLEDCKKKQHDLTERTMEYIKSCVGKCFSCLSEDDDLIWIYEDSSFGLTELRVREESNFIRQTRIDNEQAEAFIRSGFSERKGENNKDIFKHLLYTTLQNIENEAGLLY